jgi:hypothetical protein
MDDARLPARRDDEVLSDDHARSVWRRAAELQAEAAQRHDERTRQHARDANRPTGAGIRRADVQAAALEAGIAPEFVELALAELDSEATRTAPLPHWLDRTATRMLGTAQRSIEVARTIQATPARVLETMQRLFPQHPWLLTLADTVGDDPLRGILVFDAPGLTHTSSPFAMQLAYAPLKRLRVSIRAVPADGPTDACDVSIASDLDHSRRLNAFAAILSSGALGLGGAGAGFAIGTAAIGLAGATAALPVAAGFGLAAFGAARLYAILYRWGVRKAAAALDQLLRALDVHARSGLAFDATPRPPASDPTRLFPS